MSAKADLNNYSKNDNPDKGEDDQDLYNLSNLNIEKKLYRQEYPKQWCKSAFGQELKDIYDANNIHDKDINNIAEWNLLQNILNTSKHIKK